jgi:hypothetical protein
MTNYEMICFYLLGWASLEELEARLKSGRKLKEVLAFRDADELKSSLTVLNQ